MRDRPLKLLRSHETRPDPRDGAENRLIAVDLYDLVVAVCRKYHVMISGVLGAKRTQALATARHEIWWTIYEQTKLSRPEIGELFGVDPSTVLSGIESHERMMGIEHSPKWSKRGRAQKDTR